MPRRYLLILVAAAPILLALTLLPGLVRQGSRDLRMTVLDVGQGDSIFVQMPSGRTLLIDGGGRYDGGGAGAGNSSSPDAGDSASSPDAGAGASSSDVGERVVVPFLRHEGIDHIDVLILTHPHGDHVGGLPAVLRAERVGVVLDGTTVPYPSAAYQQFLDLVKADHIPYRHAVRGMKIDFGDGVAGEILNPPAQGLPYGTGDDDATINNYSVVLRLTYGRTHFMLDGDAEQEAEANILAAYPASELSADALKVGHHGSRNASSDAWLAAVHPRYGVISCGLHNEFGQPHIEALERLAAHHVQVFRTDLNGAVTITSDGTRVWAKAETPALPNLR